MRSARAGGRESDIETIRTRPRVCQHRSQLVALLPLATAEREASGTAASDSNSADEQLTVAIIVLGIILLLIVVIVAFAAVRQ